MTTPRKPMHPAAKSNHFMPGVSRVLPAVFLMCALLGSTADVSHADESPVRDAKTLDTAATVNFSRDILSVFQRVCWECHGERKQESDLRLDSADAALGHVGAIVPGRPESSELVRRIRLPRGHDEAMPNRGAPLRPDEIRRIEAWIETGAVWPADARPSPHWSYVSPSRPNVPTRPLVSSSPPAPAAPTRREPNWVVRGAIDAFVQQRLLDDRRDSTGLEPSPEAPRPELLRRLSLDLIGLPPSLAEVAAFVADESPDAYERQVERLLASDQFGVRWARPWFDYARYADSHGFQRDDLRDLWAYRDWVVDAINADLPYPQFTLEQLAGDLLPDATTSQQIATGFNRSAPTNVEAGSDPEETRVNQVFDRVNTIGMIWLGTSLECAQCHDHKYDPFTQRDYYGLFAIFNNTALEADRTNPKVPGSIQFRGPTLKVGDSATTLVMQENSPRATAVFQRGDFRSPGEPIMPALPSLFASGGAKVSTGASSSEIAAERVTRVELARWLASPDNPLVARVTVNRWWAELFGRGLVTTPEDFGVKGERPTHPELLDWLACEFMDRGWSMKQTIREIVLSATYRQSSRITSEYAARDDQNAFYARGPRHRLEAELIRDNALAIAGLLSEKRGGPSIRPYQPDGLWVKVGGQKYDYQVSPGAEKYRRGLYVVWKRAAPYPSFVNFDANSRMACRVKRPRSNTPLQALTLMNDPVYVEAAIALAARILTERPQASDSERIDHAFRLAVARAPRNVESQTLLRLLSDERRARVENVKSAERFLAEFPRPPGVDAVELAAWYAVAAALLNIDETITKG